VTLKFCLKLRLKPIASAKTQFQTKFQTKVETELWFQTKVNPNNLV